MRTADTGGSSRLEKEWEKDTFALFPGGEVLLEHGRLAAVHHPFHPRPLRQQVSLQEGLGRLHGLQALLLGGFLSDPGEDSARGAGVQDEAVLQRFLMRIICTSYACE